MLVPTHLQALRLISHLSPLCLQRAGQKAPPNPSPGTKE